MERGRGSRNEKVKQNRFELAANQSAVTSVTVKCNARTLQRHTQNNTHTHTFTHIYTHTHTNLHIHTYIRSHRHTNTCTNSQAHTHINTCKCTCLAYVHTQTKLYNHNHNHTPKRWTDTYQTEPCEQPVSKPQDFGQGVQHR